MSVILTSTVPRISKGRRARDVARYVFELGLIAMTAAEIE